MKDALAIAMMLIMLMLQALNVSLFELPCAMGYDLGLFSRRTILVGDLFYDATSVHVCSTTRAITWCHESILT